MKKVKNISTIKKKIFQAYYLLLALILVGQVVYTLYQTSLVVAYGHRQQKMRQQLEELKQTKQTAQLELAQINSIHTLRETAEQTGFEQITQPISLDPTISLASAE